ncbi:MAG TPA: gamma-glutamyltransferase family protein [archaeon]|nr:gamma-glutamyltransferase family protein [archaeon]
MQENFDWRFPYFSKRMPILASHIVSTSQPLASQAGLRMMLKGGNAVDAAVASAIALTVVEPTMNGIGSDAFVILWDGSRVVGLNASGRSPAAWTYDHFSRFKSMPLFGWDSVTIPGAVSAWVELSKKYGNLPFKTLFEPAIEYASRGFLVSPITAQAWEYAPDMYRKFPEFSKEFLLMGRAPKAGELFNPPYQAKTLELIAQTEGESFYSGNLAKKIVAFAEQTGGLLSLEDLEKHSITWEKLLFLDYKNVVLHEIPPNSQGLAALLMLGILKQFDISSYEPDSSESIHLQLEAMKLAFIDVYRYISDSASLEFDPSLLIKSNYLKKRANLISLDKAQKFEYGIPKYGDTVYLTTADEEGMMVSFIQSNYLGFGSGIVIPGTGISLQNRGNLFSLKPGHPNQVGPNKRPFHTIIPAFVSDKKGPTMSFGVMGGAMQPQGHAQLMTKIFEYGQNPQAAVDAPRWCVTQNLKIILEYGFNKGTSQELRKLGHQISYEHYTRFGGAQLIYKLNNGYLGASDSRKDGQAVGF